VIRRFSYSERRHWSAGILPANWLAGRMPALLALPDRHYWFLVIYPWTAPVAWNRPVPWSFHRGTGTVAQRFQPGRLAKP